MEIKASEGSIGLPFFAKGNLSDQEVIFGPDSISKLGEVAKELGDRALLVTDSGLAKAGHAERALDYLTRSGLRQTL